MKIVKLIFINFTILTIFSVNIFYISSCDNVPTDPEVNPGRRDYIWEVDTLEMPYFSTIHRIWGINENDVWAVGPGGYLSKTIYHYNGKKWENDNISRLISPISIWGFASNNVWIGGLEGRIWHFDGKDWKESLNLPPSQFLYSGFMDIYGDKYNDVYAVGFVDSLDGRKGMIFHYNGLEWKRVNIPKTTSTLMRIKRGLKTSKNYFIRGLVENDQTQEITKIFTFDGKKLTELYSAIDTKDKTNFIQNIDGEMIFVIGYSLNKFYKNKFVKFYEINDYNFGIPIYGRSLKDIFIAMNDGVAHYDGNNIQYLINIGENSMNEITFFEKSVFFLAYDFNNGFNLVYKGTLKE